MTTAVRYNNSVNTFLNDFFNTCTTEPTEKKTFRPRFDIVEQEEEYKLYADIPGLSKKDVSITAEEGVLTIKGERERVETTENSYRYYERNYGSFERRFNLPDEVTSEGISAEMKNGELIITVLKVEKKEPQKIDISIQ